MNPVDAKRILETALICSQQPVPVRDLRVLFDDALGADSIKTLLAQLQLDWLQRGVELVCVPAFADIVINGEERTAIRLLVQAREMHV